MMLINLNIIIAILMDGYAGVKEFSNSKVEHHVKHNVGSLLYVMLEPLRRRYQRCLSAKVARQHASDRIIINPDPLTVVPWSDDTWMEALYLVVERRKKRGIQSNICTLGGLMNHVRVVMFEKHQISETQLKAVPWLIKRYFQMRDYMPPLDIADPFHEPSDEGRLFDIQKIVKKLSDKQLPLIAAQITAMQATVDGGSSLSEESRHVARQHSSLRGSFDGTASRGAHSSALVESMQRTIEQQQTTIAEQQKIIAGLQASGAGGLEVEIREVQASLQTPRGERPAAPQQSDEERASQDDATRASIREWMEQQDKQDAELQAQVSALEAQKPKLFKKGTEGLSERLGLKKSGSSSPSPPVVAASILTRRGDSKAEPPKGMPPM